MNPSAAGATPADPSRSRWLRRHLPAVVVACGLGACRHSAAADAERARASLDSISPDTLRKLSRRPPRTAANGSPPAAIARPMTALREYFDAVATRHMASFDELANSGRARKYYDLMYAQNAFLCMFEATGDTRYLEQSLRWSQTQISLAVHVDNGNHKNWDTDPSDGVKVYGPRTMPHLLYELQGSTEMARSARLVLTDPVLTKRYGDQARAIYDFVKTEIVDKWLIDRTRLDDTLGWVLANANPQINTRFEIDDKPMMLARILMDLDAIKPDPMYFRVAYLVMQGFKARCKSWSPPGPAGTLIYDQDRISSEFNLPRPPDTAHANRHVYALLDAYHNNLVIERDEVMGFARLFGNVIWNKSQLDPRFTNYIDGGNGDFRQLPAWGNGAVFFGWDLLAAYDDDCQRASQALLNAVKAGVRNPSVDYNNSGLGIVSLAASQALSVLRRQQMGSAAL